VRKERLPIGMRGGMIQGMGGSSSSWVAGLAIWRSGTAGRSSALVGRRLVKGLVEVARATAVSLVVEMGHLQGARHGVELGVLIFGHSLRQNWALTTSETEQFGKADLVTVLRRRLVGRRGEETTLAP